jgi:pantoate--beta-alanine ligase
MQIFTTLRSLRDFIISAKAAGKSIGFVPTMGALHEGHASLVRRAVTENEVVIGSIFVNPIQFNNAEDLAKYPRTLEEDCQILKELGCNAVFAPSVEEMYPVKPELTLNFGALEQVMEGALRPGHFNGVGIVLSRLFNWVQPDTAYFGQKDFQQVAIVKRLIRDLGFPVQLVVCATLREADGLAMSSRNRRLPEAERALAPLIYQILQRAEARLKEGISSSEVVVLAEKEFGYEPAFGLEYIQVVNATDLQEVEQRQEEGNTAICVAVTLGPVRLIDNTVF